MPALPEIDFLTLLSDTSNKSFSNSSTQDDNNSLSPLKVICAWPVSGQYGAGSRFLYYVLVATCVLARKTEWLRNAALAAALVFPAVSGIHGIVLAAMDRKGGVDLDVYGALQFCAVGALTAPVTVRFSKTYFNTPGRNVIFLWTLIVLAGLMALTVEFFRLGPLPCADGGDGLPLYRLQDFEYGTTMCGLICSAEDGPHSPMRAGSANDIYVVPAPYVLTFGAATLIAAGSCIPPILSLISTWEKINFLNWQARWGRQRDVDSEPATSTNASEIHADCAGSPAEALGNTAQLNGVDNNLARGEVALPEPPPESTEQMMKINATIRELLNVIEFIVFSGAVVALIIVGEMNFWSEPLNYQTEPISNIGQWAPIVASLLAACGSLYMLLAEEATDLECEHGPCQRCANTHTSICLHQHTAMSTAALIQSDNSEMAETCRPQIASTEPTLSGANPEWENENHGLANSVPPTGAESSSGWSRMRVERFLRRVAESLQTPSRDRYDDTQVRRNALSYPLVPGEDLRVPRFNEIIAAWDVVTTFAGRSRSSSLQNGAPGSGKIVTSSRSNSTSPTNRVPQTPTTSVLSSTGKLLDVPQFGQSPLSTASSGAGLSISSKSESEAPRQQPPAVPPIIITDSEQASEKMEGRHRSIPASTMMSPTTSEPP